MNRSREMTLVPGQDHARAPLEVALEDHRAVRQILTKPVACRSLLRELRANLAGSSRS